MHTFWSENSYTLFVASVVVVLHFSIFRTIALSLQRKFSWRVEEKKRKKKTGKKHKLWRHAWTSFFQLSSEGYKGPTRQQLQQSCSALTGCKILPHPSLSDSGWAFGINVKTNIKDKNTQNKKKERKKERKERNETCAYRHIGAARERLPPFFH